jgi:hypothetical protein
MHCNSCNRRGLHVGRLLVVLWCILHMRQHIGCKRTGVLMIVKAYPRQSSESFEDFFQMVKLSYEYCMIMKDVRHMLS